MIDVRQLQLRIFFPQLQDDDFAMKKLGLPLPHGLRQILEVAGEDAAIAITLEYGGCHIEIPKKPVGTRLELIVGAQAAALLSDEFGGERLMIPLAKKQIAFWLMARGKSVSESARILRVSRNTVSAFKREFLQFRDKAAKAP